MCFLLCFNSREAREGETHGDNESWQVSRTLRKQTNHRVELFLVVARAAYWNFGIFVSYSNPLNSDTPRLGPTHFLHLVLRLVPWKQAMLPGSGQWNICVQLSLEPWRVHVLSTFSFCYGLNCAPNSLKNIGRSPNPYCLRWWPSLVIGSLQR